MNVRTRYRGAALALACVAIAGCGAGDDRVGSSDTAVAGSTAPPGGEPRSGSSAPAVSEPADDFPVTVTGDNGEVTIEARPERIVILSPTLTESAFAVGAGDQVVAVDSASNHPADVPTTDLSGFRPNVEAIGEFEPDLVLAARDRDDLVATLEGVGITVLVLPSATDLDDVYAQIETIGTATGHPDGGHDLAATMRTEIDRQLERIEPAEPAPTYFYELSADFHTLTSDTFVGSILAELGLDNIADQADPAAGAYPQLTAEYVLDADPAHLFVAHTDGSVPTLDELSARPGWTTLSAVSGDAVTWLDPDIASRWGPRVVDLVTMLVDDLDTDARDVDD
ncbi:MAG: ABC transporter substrate-binding protein [Desertimonas sp.]